MSESLPPETRDATVRLLEIENERLRREQIAARRAEYRRSATGMIAIGILAVIGALLVPAVREVLLVLGAIGIFVGLLVYYLTPETFVAASVGERVYSTMAGNHEAIIDALGLQDTAIYYPADSDVWLYVPEQDSGDVPDPADAPFPTGSPTRGLTVRPIGSALIELIDDPQSPDVLANRVAHLGDALVEVFELAANIESTMGADEHQVTIAVTGGAFGPLDRFDHPIPSVIATGIAAHLDQSVRVDITRADGRADWLVTCSWDE